MANLNTSNEIVERQNSEQGLTLLKARQQCFTLATKLQILQVSVTVVLPIVATIIAIFNSSAQPFVAAIAFFILLFDATVLYRLNNKFLKNAAKYAEEFDCYVLQLPWNDFVCGAKQAPEKTSRVAAAFGENPKSLADINDWYPATVDDAPIQYARLACQRSNLWYEAELRKRYSNALVIIPAIIFALFLFLGLVLNLLLTELVLSIMVPAAPILLWSFREFFQHKDTALAQRALMVAVESLWEHIKATDIEPSVLLSRSREFQDAIFLRRKSNPLILPIVYKFYRPSMEVEMNIGAAERLRELDLANRT